MSGWQLRGRAGDVQPLLRGILWLVLAGAPSFSTAAEAIRSSQALEDHLTRQWYATEVIVFQRPAVQDHMVTEQLARPPAPLPRNLHTFRSDPPRSSTYDLYPLTHAYLAFPYLAPLPRDTRDETSEESWQRDEYPEPELETLAVPPIEPRLEADPLLDFLAAVADFEATLEGGSYRWMERETFTLTGPANRLARTAGHQVLLHGRWLQPVPSREAPEPLLIRAGSRDQRGAYALEGTFDVTLGRFLHFGARLYYREPLLGQAPLDPARPPSGQPGAIGQALTAGHYTGRGVMQMAESRRLRSGELHYLDHPKLGILVRIEPVTPPESLSAAYLALKELQE
jgi:hypothetical protein